MNLDTPQPPIKLKSQYIVGRQPITRIVLPEQNGITTTLFINQAGEYIQERFNSAGKRLDVKIITPLCDPSTL